MTSNDVSPRNRAERRLAGKKARAAGAVLTAGSAALAMGAAWVGPGITAAGAATFTVSNNLDSGAGSLRQAILDANGSAGADTISVGAVGTISLASDLPAITDDLTITGPGAAAATVSGGDTFSLFYASGAVSDFTVSGLTLADGTDSDGGAIRSQATNLTVDLMVFTSNSTSGSGGGVASSGAGTVTVTNSTFSGNSSSSEGGGLYVTAAASTTVSGSTFTGNTADSDAGGINVSETDGPVVVSNTVLSGNSATDGGGGGFYSDDVNGSVTFSGVTVTGNSAVGGGGGMSIFDTEGDVLITGSVISGNQADHGGGLYTNNRPGVAMTIEYTTISGNTATEGWGGGIYAEEFYGGSLTVRNSTLSGNTASGGGGGMSLYRMLVPVSVLNSTISGNTGESSGGGGILLLGFYGLDLVQSTVTANSAPVGGGLEVVNVQAGDARAKANAADTGGRESDGPGARAAAIGDGEVNIVGTIVAGNTADDLGADEGTAVSDHSIIGVVAAGFAVTDVGGTIFGVDPLVGALANNGGPTQTHELLAGSPAIDAGPNPVPTFPGNEFDQRGTGYARVVGGTVDIGAFEVQPPPIVIQPRFTG